MENETFILIHSYAFRKKGNLRFSHKSEKNFEQMLPNLLWVCFPHISNNCPVTNTEYQDKMYGCFCVT